ncbi:AAA family ATPase [Idiomarina aquatica]|uniref:Protein CR006 P-loop domain-containing protein n=1 Tax=Idiomarina aquatica TaxID=1327752 RepID=A0AA94JD75_9GAMM|nr:AAA family ATPase [Idiomarina aquatica]RUO44492.1 hypothetical protein CWE23_00120 [Idiomarina aquatica]
MLSKISLKGVTSYSPTTPCEIIDLNKKVNLFFGLNGSGKSTIGNYLQSISEPNFSECSVEPYPLEAEVIVYNQKFIEDNFYQKPSQQGIFTVGEENKEIQEDIEKKLVEIDELESRLNEIEENAKNNTSEIEKLENQLRDKVWKHKELQKSDTLRFCYQGKNTKAKFLEEVLKHPEEPIKNLKELDELAKNLSDDTLPKPLHRILDFPMSALEQDPVLQQSIVGSDDSYLSSLVETLNNSDWVKKGMVYVNDQDDCPFCQRALPDGFKVQLEKLFDETYEQRLNDLEKLKNDYHNAITLLSSDVDSLRSIDENRLTTLLELLESEVESNVRKIDSKISSPSKTVQLKNTATIINEINEIVSELNEEIQEFNARLNDKEKYKGEIRDNYWRNIFDVNRSAIEIFNEKKQSKNNELSALRCEYKKVKVKKNESKIELTKLQEHSSGAQLSISVINTQLKSLGITSFSIVPSPEDQGLYRISRQNSSEEEVYATLSEGEKTLLTFLYFIESCYGSKNKDEAVVLNNRIIVIDDPISSLSHNFVFDIASIIHHKIICENFRQVFVLTHNMYFFHELLLLRSPVPTNNINDYNLFRVSKSDYSSVQKMERNSLQNDYQTYWQIVRDCRDGLMSSNMLPNAMRNILEHYFNFIHNKGKLKTTLEELGEEVVEFKPFFRFVSRMSHSDAVNLFDTGALPKDKYLETFEEIFRRTGFHDHYKHMMED